MTGAARSFRRRAIAATVIIANTAFAPHSVNAQTAPAAATPAPRVSGFAAADALVLPKVYNELSPGNGGNVSWSVHGAAEFTAGHLTLMAQGDFVQYRYAHDALHADVPCAPGATGCAVATAVGTGTYRVGVCPMPDPGCVTVVGYPLVQAVNGLTQAYVPALSAHEERLDLAVGVKVLKPNVFATASYLSRSFGQLGYPRISGAGVGLSALPDPRTRIAAYGRVAYYPNVSGTYGFPSTPFLGALSGATTTLAYRYWTYRAGATVALRNKTFADVGIAGERGYAGTNAPSNTNLFSPYVGVGVRF